MAIIFKYFNFKLNFANAIVDPPKTAENQRCCTNRKREVKWRGKVTEFMEILEISGAIYLAHQCPLALLSYQTPCIIFHKNIILNYYILYIH